MTRRALLGALLVLLTTAPAGRAETVASGPLRADTSDDPWHLAFTDARGPLLAEHPVTGAGPAGTLGFRASGQWRHATRVVSNSLQASLATLERPFRPCRVRLNDRPLRRGAWRYQRRSRVLRLRFRARRARLGVAGCDTRPGRKGG